MAGIPRPHTQHADGEDELIFHFELGETPLPASTVATSDEYLFNNHNDLEALRPVKGYALGRPRGSSHELEPSSSLYPRTKVMAAQAIEALNRTFIDLKSKNEETRLRASYDLREQVVSAARGEASPPPRLFCAG